MTHPMTHALQYRETAERDFARNLVAAALVHERTKPIADLACWFQAAWIADPFYRELCRVLFALNEQGEPLTVAGLMREFEPATWNSGTLGRLIHECHSIWWHLNYLAGQVYECYRRQRVADEMEVGSNDLRTRRADVDDILDDVSDLKNKYAPQGASIIPDTRDVFDELLDELETGERVGWMTGIHALDAILEGVPPGALVVVGARTGSGKSTLLGHMAAVELFDRKRPAIFYALEMSNREMFKRWAKWIDGARHRDNSPSLESLAEVRNAVESNLYFQAGGITIEQIERETRIQVAESNAAIVCVDYLQQVGAKGRYDTREQTVADITRRLKQIAMSSGKVVLVASQLNRGTPTPGGSQRPSTRHLRESGAIEQDADIVILIDPQGEIGSDDLTVRLVVAKNRHGRTGIADVCWRMPYYRYDMLNRHTEFDDWNEQ